MVLRPMDVFNKFEQKRKLETSSIVNSMMHKDTEMTKLLYRKDLSDDEEKAMYDANLQRNLDLKPQKDDAAPTVQLATSNKSWLHPERTCSSLIRSLWEVFLKKCVQEQLHY